MRRRIAAVLVLAAAAGGWWWHERAGRNFAALNRQALAEIGFLRDSGDLGHLRRAERLTAESLRLAPESANPAGLVMDVLVAMGGHHFEAARAGAERLEETLPGNPYPCQVLGDALFELGRYEAAEKAWKSMANLSGAVTAAAAARQAELDLLHGQVAAGRDHLAAALRLARESGAASPSEIAACAVQCGEAAFRAGDWDQAERFYAAALSTFPGGFAATEHLAELRGAQGRIAEAESLYRRLIAKVDRPELAQDLGDLLAFVGRRDEAKPWLERARQGYLASVGRGEVLYFHHLSGLFADSLGEPAPALSWAERDLAERRTIQAYDALAWALTKSGRMAEAEEAAAKALATGTKDPHILYHAALLHIGAGDLRTGSAYLREAAESNPRFTAFHVHR